MATGRPNFRIGALREGSLEFAFERYPIIEPVDEEWLKGQREGIGIVATIINEAAGDGAVPGKLVGAQVATNPGVKLRICASFCDLLMKFL
jgi:hypothetical protein